MSDYIRGSADRPELLQMVRQIMGKTCWRVEFSYGDELDLDLGQRRFRATCPLRDTSYGEYQLCILIDDWTLLNPSGQQLASGSALAVHELDDDASAESVASYEQHRRDILTRLSAIVDQAVTSIEVDDADLSLRVMFANALTLTVTCGLGSDQSDQPQDDECDEPMACWELYMPDGSLAELNRVGAVPDWPLAKILPGGLWTVTSWGGP